MKHLLAAMIGIISIASSSIAETPETQPRVRSYVDKKSVFIGDHVKYTIDVTPLKDQDIAFPEFKGAKLGDFEIKDHGKRAARPLFGKQVISQWYYIAAYSVGKHAIPPLEIRYRNKDKEDWSGLNTKEMKIIVESVLPRNEVINDIKDIKGPIHPGGVNWFMAGTLGAIAILACAGLVSYIKRKRRKPARLAHEIALEEIESLKASFARNGNAREYYIGISDCTRRYIERRFSLKAPEMTTEEFLISSKASPVLSVEQKGMLKEFLEACDLVKFARYAPKTDEIESVYLTAKKFIDQTKKKALKEIDR